MRCRLNVEGGIGEAEEEPFSSADDTHFMGDYGKPLSDLIDDWIHKESEFSFMETLSNPEKTETVIELVGLLRHSDLLINQIQEVAQRRNERGESQLDPVLLTQCRFVDDICFLEKLEDEGVYTFLRGTLETERRYSRLIHGLFGMYKEAFNIYQKALINCLREEVEYVSKDDDDYDLWKQLLDDQWLDEDGILASQLDLFCEHACGMWLQQCQSDEWQSHHAWREEVGEEAALLIWSEVIEPFFVDRALSELKSQRSTSIIQQAEQHFEALLDTKRPKDQRIGSFWIDEDHPEKITVVFLTRDGKLLAQRAVVWKPDQANSIVDAFEEININTLTYPSTHYDLYASAIEKLSNHYQLHAVLPYALDTVKYPQGLSSVSQRALRIGQRFVAPLRFYPRADLQLLMSSLIGTEAIECLFRSGSGHLFIERLNDLSAKRWLELRYRRSLRSKRSWEDPADQQVRAKRTISSEGGIRPGDHLKVRVVAHQGDYFDVETLDKKRMGKLKMTSGQLRRLSQEHGIETDQAAQVLNVQVLGEDHTTGELSLKLLFSKKRPRKQRSLEQPNSEKDTLARLDSLFSIHPDES